MKFGEKFNEYRTREPYWFTTKCSSHIEYKRLKKVLKRCRTCQASLPSSSLEDGSLPNQESICDTSRPCPCESCTLCDQNFFSDLLNDVSGITWCFTSRVKHLLHIHVARGLQRYVNVIRTCFKQPDQESMVEEGRMLLEYITMNAIAIRKILKKYDKVHSSDMGKYFRLKLRSEHLELLQSPWIIELGAFALNFAGENSNEFSNYFALDLENDEPLMTLAIPNWAKLEYNLKCPVCLELVVNPYALSCGHLYCKQCACSAASVLLFQGLKTADSNAKCPVCRDDGVYLKAVHMLELDLLIRRRCSEYWKERMCYERAEMIKQSKEYWELQTQIVLGF